MANNLYDEAFDDEPNATTEKDILTQMGYYRDDTMFCSLNLTDEQCAVLGEATGFAAELSTEEMIVEALRYWMASKQAQTTKVA